MLDLNGDLNVSASRLSNPSRLIIELRKGAEKPSTPAETVTRLPATGPGARGGEEAGAARGRSRGPGPAASNPVEPVAAPLNLPGRSLQAGDSEAGVLQAGDHQTGRYARGSARADRRNHQERAPYQHGADFAGAGARAEDRPRGDRPGTRRP